VGSELYSTAAVRDVVRRTVLFVQGSTVQCQTVGCVAICLAALGSWPVECGDGNWAMVRTV
jgi:hypothetical protein